MKKGGASLVSQVSFCSGGATGSVLLALTEKANSATTVATIQHNNVAFADSVLSVMSFMDDRVIAGN